MRPEDFTYVVESQHGAREALAAVWEAAMTVGWVVVGDYDLSGLLGEYDGRRAEQNGHQEVKSIDICRPDLARPFVAAEALTALCMPCSVLIYTDGTGTKLAAMRPSVIVSQLFSDAARAVGDLSARVDHELLQILEAAKE